MRQAAVATAETPAKSQLVESHTMLASLKFENRFVEHLPGDAVSTNYVRRVTGACYSLVEPASSTNPELVAYSKEVAALIGLPEESCKSEDFVQVFVGNKKLSGMMPYSMCYGGHQFGNWAGQLGDGRAINLGDVRGVDGCHYTLQLKGAGLTPYSRTADGLAVLRSSLREFVCSEAMHHLGVPTTRALSLVLTGDQVVRDMLYDGHPAPELGAVVCRVAPTFIRFGNFEIFAAQRNFDIMRQLIDHTIEFDFPNLTDRASPQAYVEWFENIVERTAYLISEWVRVGFVHGVMNTDNMSITGLTIDYGPYGWIESYDPNWTPNTTDAATRRYRFGQQPAVAQWNLLQLANAIAPVIGETKPLEDALNQYSRRYGLYYSLALAKKLGLESVSEGDSDLFNGLEEALVSTEIDMTLFFRFLADLNIEATAAGLADWQQLRDAFYSPEQVNGEIAERMNRWLRDYSLRIRSEGLDATRRIEAMNNANPLYVPRNYLAQLAIDEAEQGNYSYLHEWLDVLRNPYEFQIGKEQFAAKRPEWARTRVGCSMLSCSS